MRREVSAMIHRLNVFEVYRRRVVIVASVLQFG